MGMRPCARRSSKKIFAGASEWRGQVSGVKGQVPGVRCPFLLAPDT
jgi:hypothetical protein